MNKQDLIEAIKHSHDLDDIECIVHLQRPGDPVDMITRARVKILRATTDHFRIILHLEPLELD